MKILQKWVLAVVSLFCILLYAKSTVISGNAIGNGSLEFYKVAANAVNGTTTPIVNSQSAMVPLTVASELNSGDLVAIYANPSKSGKLRSFTIDGVNYNSSPVTITIGSKDIVASATFSNGSVLFKESFGSYSGATSYDKTTLTTALNDGSVTFDNSLTTASYGFAIGTNVRFSNPSNGTEPKAACFFIYGRNNAITTTFSTPITGANMQLKFRLNPNIPASTATAYLLGLDSALRIRINDLWQYRCLNKAIITTFRKSQTAPLQSSYAFEVPFLVVPLNVSSINKLEIRSELVSAANHHGQFYFDDIEIVADSLPKIGETTVASNITEKNAISGGTILSDGGSQILARGACWSRLPNPTIENGFKSSTSGSTGQYTISLDSLLSSTKYYVRAYVTNNVGTVYGTEISFTTLPGGSYPIYEQFIMCGQSLSVGAHSYPSLSLENTNGVYQIGDQIWYNYGNSQVNTLTPLVSKISANYASLPSIMNGDAVTPAECPLTGAVNHIKLKSGGNNIIASSCGTAGMSIEQLSKESLTKASYNAHFLPAVKASVQVTQFMKSKVVCPTIFWMQGESNYMGVGEGLTVGTLPTAEKTAYKDLFLTLKNNMQTDIQSINGQSEKPLFITYQVGGTSLRGKDLTISMAQLEASNEHNDIICAGPSYPVTNRGLHLDPNGYRWFGEMLGKVYYKTNVLGETFKPLQPKVISRTTNPNELKIKFLVPSSPLVLDDKLVAKVSDYGFEVYLDNVKQTINSIYLNDNSILLSCALPLNGVVEVVYAGTSTKGKGNLRDSDPYQSYFKYIDLDKTNPDGSFVYPRDAGTTTLRPAYEPKGEDGNPLYDQYYPMYNFCLSFYYKLNAGEVSYSVPNLDETTGTNSVITRRSISAYQSGDSLIIDCGVTTKSSVKIKIVEVTGRIIDSFDAKEQRIYYPLSKLKKGTYITQVIKGHETFALKIITR